MNWESECSFFQDRGESVLDRGGSVQDRGGSVQDREGLFQDRQETHRFSGICLYALEPIIYRDRNEINTDIAHVENDPCDNPNDNPLANELGK